VLLFGHVSDCSCERRRSQPSVGQPNEQSKRNARSRFVAQALLVTILPHALASLVFRNLRFASFL
jgi:hypothetical protein